MRRRREDAQLELGLTQRLCWHELPEASQAHAVQLLVQLLVMVAQVRQSDQEATDER
jgi:hypothetical protein